ncbi:MAG: LysM domain-containing protein [Anaerolineae bacterium]|nr:LysM domain-containing protein [Anaerolineae bacterium]
MTTARKFDTRATYAVYLNDDGQAFLYDGQAWNHALGEPPGLVDVVVWTSGMILALASDKFVWSYDPIATKWTKDPVASNVTSLSVDDQKNVWCVNTSGEVYLMQAGTPLGSWRMIWKDIPAIAKQPPGGVWEYSVKPGEWLSLIVRREYKIPANDWDTTNRLIAQIKALNPSLNVDHIEAGQVLKMPAKS